MGDNILYGILKTLLELNLVYNLDLHQTQIHRYCQGKEFLEFFSLARPLVKRMRPSFHYIQHLYILNHPLYSLIRNAILPALIFQVGYIC
ncbi:hypothetical protein SDC9_208913 [bioreactor metagenome]|uniref:Uncharacterized protein n=1 Tax=bioreactor metagenome TaxID=1076179 RepID=A0A645JEV0_9ZZZZ